MSVDDFSFEAKVRNPKQYKGLRVRFRTVLGPTGHRYNTALLREGILAVMVKRGNNSVASVQWYVDAKFPDGTFEGFRIKVYLA